MSPDSSVAHQMLTTGKADPRAIMAARIRNTNAVFAQKVRQLRAALLASVSGEDILEIMAKMLEKAKAGDIVAAGMVLERTLGKPVEADLMDQMENLEGQMAVVIANQEHVNEAQPLALPEPEPQLTPEQIEAELRSYAKLDEGQDVQP